MSLFPLVFLTMIISGTVKHGDKITFEKSEKLENLISQNLAKLLTEN